MPVSPDRSPEVESFLLELTDRQSAAVGAREIMQISAEALGRQLLVGRVGYSEATADNRHMVFETGWAQPPLQALSGSVPMEHWSRDTSTDFSRGRTVVYNDVRTEPGLGSEVPNYLAIGAVSVVAVPYLRGGVWRGSLYVNDHRPRAWTPGEVAMIEEVARRTAEAAERAQAEAALRQSEEQLRMAMEAARLSTWYCDIPRGVVSADAEMRKLFGIDTVEAAPEPWIAAIHVDDRERVTGEFNAALSGAPYDTTFRVVAADGKTHWISSRAKLLDRSGSRLVGILEDITTRKQAEEELRSLATRLSLAQKAGTMAAWQWDLATGQFVWDEGSQWTYGRPPEQMAHIDLILPYLHEEDRALIERELEPVLAGEGLLRTEFRVLWPDGSLHWIQAFGQPVLGPNNKPASLVGINIDITERKLSEAALMQNEKLAAVGRLASSIAHEINNPLESVTNLLFLARTSGNADEITGYLEHAEEELRRVSIISNQTLRFHKQSTNARSVTCSELFESVLSIYQGRLLNSSIVLEKRKRSQRAVECFDGEIRQVLNNLVGNAFDAMEAGGRLLLRSRDAHHPRTGQDGIVLTVADTGAGIPEASVAKIFDAFYTTKGIGGTGLGLWVSKEIVDRHHGSLRVRSSQNQKHHGTVFTLFLPVKAAAR